MKFCCDITPDPLPVCTDAHSYIICKELTLIGCGSGSCGTAVVNNGLYLCDCADSWNCNLCGNDLPFFNVVEAGDSIFLQFQQIDNINGNDPNVTPTAGFDLPSPLSAFVTAEIYDCCDGVTPLPLPGGITSVSNKWFVGTYPVTNYDGSVEYFNIQQIEIDVNEVNNLFADPSAKNCFYFKFKFFSSLGGDFEELCTEPFKMNTCPETDQTIVIQGEYENKDCFGYYYGLPSSWVGSSSFEFENIYRVRGAFEMQTIEIDKELVTKFLVATNSLKCELWLMSTYGVPERIAVLIANQLNAKIIYINDQAFQITKELSKNNETGNQWFITSEMKRCDCYTDFSCQ